MTIGGTHELPCIKLDVRVIGLCIREAETLTRNLLVVHESSQRGIAKRCMSDDQLRRCKRACVRWIMSGRRAKERDLETERFAVRLIEPTRCVPPFGAKGRMRAGIVRKDKRMIWRDGGELRRHGRCVCQAANARHHKPSPRLAQQCSKITHHQSSLTARTASSDTALRPATTAVAHDEISITSATVLNTDHGICIDMLQWNDCGLTTKTRMRLIAHPRINPIAIPSAVSMPPSPPTLTSTPPPATPTRP